MLIDAASFGDAVNKGAKQRTIASFLRFVERKLGVTILYDKRRVPYGRIDLLEPLDIADKLMGRGIIDLYGPRTGLPDEPPIRIWSCRITDSEHSSTGGASSTDDASALYAALGESLERYLWWTQKDYFVRPHKATVEKMRPHFSIIAPEQFAGFSKEQREQDPRLHLALDAQYLWIEGVSLVTGKRIYAPAQQVSAAHRPWSVIPREPLIRTQITNGLATWPTKAGARLAGALECLEREAYMIMWFNQLTLPRARLSSLRKRSTSLDALIARCERYRLRVHIIPMLTDAPTHAVCAMLEDESGVGPRFVCGLKAHRSLPHAAERAILEALRARRFTRDSDPSKHYDASKSVDYIGHRGRVYYWWDPEHAKHLEFMIAGEEKDIEEAAWEGDSIEENLERAVGWCRERKYECAAFSFGTSKMNPTPWHVEMVVMPEIQPTHLSESLRHLGGERLKSVPRQFGYTPRETPFIERPHPFC